MLTPVKFGKIFQLAAPVKFGKIFQLAGAGRSSRPDRTDPAQLAARLCTSRGGPGNTQLVAPSRGPARSSQIVAHLGLYIGAVAHPGHPCTKKATLWTRKGGEIVNNLFT
jgi:hypothetical protein